MLGIRAYVMNIEKNYSYSDTIVNFQIHMKTNYPPYFIKPLDDIYLKLNESFNYVLP